jgi:type IV pilus assembly protein PilE
MKTSISTHRPAARGFTLVELMVTIMVGAILAAIAVPAYTTQVRKSRRTEARSALLDAAAREERYYGTNNQYTTTASFLGYTALPTAVGSQYYQLSVACVGAAGTTAGSCASGYLLTATAINSQVKDTLCATLTVDNTGAQNATGTANPLSQCWN